MVTVSELETREKELDKLEQEARSIESIKVPERKFGSGVTPKQQQDVIRRRQTGSRVLREAQEERESIARAREQIRQRKLAEQEIEELERKEREEKAKESFLRKIRFKKGIATAALDPSLRKRRTEELEERRDVARKRISEANKQIALIEEENGIRLSTSEKSQLRKQLVEVQEGKRGSVEVQRIIQPREVAGVRPTALIENVGEPTVREEQVNVKNALIVADAVNPVSVTVRTIDAITRSKPVTNVRDTLTDVFLSKPPKKLGDVFDQDKTFLRRTLETQSFIFVKPFEVAATSLKEGGALIKSRASSISLKPTGKNKVVDTIKNIRRIELKATGIGVGAVGELIPETPAGITLVGVLGKFVKRASPFGRTVVGTGIGTAGTVGVFDKEATIEQKVASGAVGVAGFGGAIGTTAPFIKGQLSRFSTRFSRVQTETITSSKGFKFETDIIKDVNKGEFNIGIVPEGVGKKPRGRFDVGEGALFRGGFGFSAREQITAFSNKVLRLTSGQRKLPAPILDVIKSDPKVSPLGFFFTPADPISKLPQVRISRIGLDSSFFRRPKTKADLGLDFNKADPTILVTEPTKLGTRKVKIAPKGSAELEVTSASNFRITDKGVTTLKGQRVKIFTGVLTDSKLTGRKGIGDVIPFTTRTSRTISPSLRLGSFLSSFSLPTRPRSVVTTTTFLPETVPTFTSRDIKPTKAKPPTRVVDVIREPTTPTTRIGGGTSITTTTTKITTPFIPKTPKIPTVKRPPKTPRIPPFSPPSRPPRRPPKTPVITPPPIKLFNLGGRLPTPKKKKKRGEEGIFFVPSFTASTLKISKPLSDKQLLSLSTGISSGLRFRPIPKRRKRK